MISYSRTVAATATPVTVAELTSHLRITDSAEEALLDVYLRAAVEHLERTTGVRLLTQTWVATLDYQDVPSSGELELRGRPLQSVSGITYVDTGGTTQTWSSALYTVDTAVVPGRIYPAYNQDWPTVRDQQKALSVTYLCGWTSAAAVPAPLKHALKLLVGHWHETREATVYGQPPTSVPLGYEALIAPYRHWKL